MVPNRKALLTLGLVTAMVLSGCLGTGPLSEQQEERVADEFEDRFAAIDGFTATIHTEATGENVSFESSAQVWQRPSSGEMRQEVLAPAEQAGDVTVTNESTSIYYDASENTYRKMDIAGVGGAGSTDLGTQLRNLLDRFDVVYDGTTTIDGQETYKVTLEPSNETEALGQYQMEMWLDTEEYFPVQQRMESEELGFESTVRYENVSINPGIPDERFTFEPPADATEAETGFETYQSREALADATNVTLPEPALPDGYEFQAGTVSDFGGNRSVTLRYVDGDTSLTLSIETAGDDPSEGDETVDVGDRTGQYSEMSDVGHLAWTCEDTAYSVTGGENKETLTDVAASVGCPA